MEIISQPFLVFTLAVLVVYHILPARGQNVWLLACSFYFAASWRWEYAAVLALSIMVNYLFGMLINRSNSDRLIWLITGISLNVLGLVLFRMTGNSLFDSLARIVTGGTTLSTRLLIPIGFSFYTLQAISYLVDVYKRKIQPAVNLIDFGLYLAYFPRLVSGPIERAGIFLPQLQKDRLVTNADLAEGGWQICIGLFRKLVIASLLFTLIPEGVFTRPTEFAQSDRWTAILVYTFWLYNDFAGYTSLVRGISRLFGIRLSPNFRQPLFAPTMLDFWNRWHMSLSFWLRDYIFFPVQRWLARLNLSSTGILRITLPPFITMIVSGLWHNATLSMVGWGLLHGLYQAGDHLISRRPGYIPPLKRPIWQRVFLSLKVFLLLLPAWILFASGGLKLALIFASALFRGGGITRIRPLELIVPLFGIIISFGMDFLQEKFGEEQAFSHITRWKQSTIAAIMIFGIVLSILWMNVPEAAFVYQGF